MFLKHSHSLSFIQTQLFQQKLEYGKHLSWYVNFRLGLLLKNCTQ